MSRKAHSLTKCMSAGMLSVALMFVFSPAYAGPAWGVPGWRDGPIDPSPPPREKREPRDRADQLRRDHGDQLRGDHGDQLRHFKEHYRRHHQP
jgi:hypothetical protein